MNFNLSIVQFQIFKAVIIFFKYDKTFVHIEMFYATINCHFINPLQFVLNLYDGQDHLTFCFSNIISCRAMFPPLLLSITDGEVKSSMGKHILFLHPPTFLDSNPIIKSVNLLPKALYAVNIIPDNTRTRTAHQLFYLFSTSYHQPQNSKIKKKVFFQLGRKSEKVILLCK